MDDIVAIILEKVPVGVIVFDRKLQMVYTNRMASNFLKRFFLPEEIQPLTRRIFDAVLSNYSPAKFTCSRD